MNAGKVIAVYMTLAIVTFSIVTSTRNRSLSLRAKKGRMVKNFKKLKKMEGAVKLVGGSGEFEGNVEILHKGQWGAVCDDEWDKQDGAVVCKQLGYPAVNKVVHSSTFGLARRRFWMDNTYCDGTEAELAHCRFDGWSQNDCTPEEAAGVICATPKPPEPVIKPREKIPLKSHGLRIAGGRTKAEGRVEVLDDSGTSRVICGDGWTIREAMVVCRELGLGYANEAIQTDFFGGNMSAWISGVKCRGTEERLAECLHDKEPFCPGSKTSIAAVICTRHMADLQIDHIEIMHSAHLEGRPMFFLQCAMEENCVASQAYAVQRDTASWHLETRRLLKFTAKIMNVGTADFRPAIPKHLWEWHMCHMHYHSMEIFATFDIFNSSGARVAEGHKASFCLEDNQCLPGVPVKYKCANYGDQGISVGCSDIYKYSVDCQWVDITELDPGVYTFRVAVNPELKVPEMTYENNVAVCTFYYGLTGGSVHNCSVVGLS